MHRFSRLPEAAEISHGTEGDEVIQVEIDAHLSVRRSSLLCILDQLINSLQLTNKYVSGRLMLDLIRSIEPIQALQRPGSRKRRIQETRDKRQETPVAPELSKDNKNWLMSWSLGAAMLHCALH